MALGKLIFALEARTGKWEGDLKKAQREAERRARAIEKRFTQLGTVIGGALTAGAVAISAQVRKSINDMDDLAKAAQRVGTSVENLSALQFAAGLSGVQNLEGGLRALTRAAGNAAAGSKEVEDVFKGLGVEVLDANGNLRDTNEIMLDLADVFKNLPDGPEKTFAATKLRIQELVPLLNGGREGIKALTDEAAQLGLVVDTQTAKAAELFNDNLSRLASVADAFGRQLAAELLPTLIELTERLLELVKNGDLASKTANLIKSEFEGLAKFFRATSAEVDLLSATYDKFTAALSFNAEEFDKAVARQVRAAQQLKAAGGQITIFGQDLADASGLSDNQAGELARLTPGSSGGPSTRGGRRRGRKDEIEEEKTATNQLLAAIAAMRQQDELAAQAKRAKAKAEREAAEAAKRAKEIAEQNKEAVSSLNSVLRSQAEEYDGPLEKAARKYADAMLEILLIEQQLAETGAINADISRQIAKARENAAKIFEEDKSRKSDVDKYIESLRFELSLIGMTNAEREKAIALRQLDGKATAEQAAEISNLIDQLIEQQEAIAVMDSFRNAASDAFASFIDGSKSAKDAFADFAQFITQQVARMLANKAVESLFGNFGTGGGGWVSSFLGALGFGGARANGGPVSPGMVYRVNEREPEFFRPTNSGTVIPLSKMSGGRGGTTVNITLPATIERRTALQVANRTADAVTVAGRNR